MKNILFMSVFAFAVFSQAALLNYENGVKSMNGVNLKKSAKILDRNGQPTDLKMDLLGAGLRQKTILVATTKVYVAQLFSDNKAAFNRDANLALTSLIQSSNRIALRIDMLRTVSSSSLVDSFKEALAANNISLDSDLNNALNLMEKAADGVAGKSITLLMAKDNNKTNLYYEDTNGDVKSMMGSADMMLKIMSIWLGQPADDGLAELKTQLLKPVY